MAPDDRGPVRCPVRALVGDGVLDQPDRPGLLSHRSRRGGPACREPGTELEAPLFDVCFAVVDVETTGGSPATGALTEIAAAKYQGGECVGEFQTLVDPGCSVPPLISLLTGITDDMVLGAPPVSSVLPSLLEFLRGW